MTADEVIIPPRDIVVASFNAAGGVIPANPWFFERVYPKFYELSQEDTPTVWGIREFVDRFHATVEGIIVSLGPTGEKLEPLLRMETDSIIGVMIPDPEIAQIVQLSYNLTSALAAYDREEAAKQFHQEELALTPISPEDPYTTTSAEAKLVAASAHRIADLFFTHVQTWDAVVDRSRPYVSYEDWRYQDINPSWNQTDSGLFVEIDYYGLPQAVYTPWGKYDFAGGGSLYGDAVKSAARQIGEHLTLEMYFPGRPEVSENAVYKVLAIDGRELPPAVMKPSRETYISRETARQLWIDLTPADSGAAQGRKAREAPLPATSTQQSPGASPAQGAKRAGTGHNTDGHRFTR